MKYTVITGASAGIGLATVHAFAKRGNNLLLVARRVERMKQLKEELKKLYPAIDVVIFNTDLTDIDGVYTLYEELSAYDIEIFINNAGMGYYGDVADLNLKKVEQLLALNITALTILSALFVRDYEDKEGAQLINVSSVAGYGVAPELAVYSGSKFYVSAFTEGLAKELKQKNAKMQVKIIAPSRTKTEFAAVARDVDYYDYDKSNSPYKLPEEVADFLIKLMDSDKNVGIVDPVNGEFELRDFVFKHY